MENRSYSPELQRVILLATIDAVVKLEEDTMLAKRVLASCWLLAEVSLRVDAGDERKAKQATRLSNKLSRTEMGRRLMGFSVHIKDMLTADAEATRRELGQILV